MNASVLDTSVASLMFRDSPLFALYQPLIDESSPVLCFQTIAEMRFGAILRRWSARRQRELETFLADFDVIVYSDVLATHWAQIMHDARRAGRRLEAGDAWIAATAGYLNAPLLTHDKDFSIEAIPSITVYRFIDASETAHP